MGPVEALCTEVGYRFDYRLEKHRFVFRFVRLLLAHIETDRYRTQRSEEEEKAVTDVLTLALQMVACDDVAKASRMAEHVHLLADELNPEESPTHSYAIDAVSACASALRFSFSFPQNSRHMAAAAKSVCNLKYRMRVSDRTTLEWMNGWVCDQISEVLLHWLDEVDTQLDMMDVNYQKAQLQLARERDTHNLYVMSAAVVAAYESSPEGSGVDLSLGLAAGALLSLIEGESDPLVAVCSQNLTLPSDHWLARWQRDKGRLLMT
jgi:hypothetical protein